MDANIHTDIIFKCLYFRTLVMLLPCVVQLIIIVLIVAKKCRPAKITCCIYMFAILEKYEMIS